MYCAPPELLEPTNKLTTLQLLPDKLHSTHMQNLWCQKKNSLKKTMLLACFFETAPSIVSMVSTLRAMNNVKQIPPLKQSSTNYLFTVMNLPLIHESVTNLPIKIFLRSLSTFLKLENPKKICRSGFAMILRIRMVSEVNSFKQKNN